MESSPSRSGIKAFGAQSSPIIGLARNIRVPHFIALLSDAISM